MVEKEKARKGHRRSERQDKPGQAQSDPSALIDMAEADTCSRPRSRPLTVAQGRQDQRHEGRPPVAVPPR